MLKLKNIIPAILVGCTIANVAYSSEEINIIIENSTGKVAKRTIQGKENSIAGNLPESVENIQHTQLQITLNGRPYAGIGAVYEIEKSTDDPVPEAACLFGVAFSKEGRVSELVARHFFAAHCDAREIGDHTVRFSIEPK